VLDDPFVTFDDERATRAIELIKDVAGEFQVILLTCSDRFDAMADNVVVLPAPTEHDDFVPVEAPGPTEPIAMWSSTSLPETPAAARSTNGNGRGQHASTKAEVTGATARVEPAPLWPEER
jgi:hypothetical protein